MRTAGILLGIVISLYAGVRAWSPVGEGKDAAAALRDDPASPFRWCDFGFALLDAGRKDEARRCFERAVALGPNLISNLSLAARFYYSIGEPREALRCNARLLELEPQYRSSILDTYASSQYEPADVLDYGLPQNPVVARDFFRVLLRNDEPEVIRHAWQWLAGRSVPDPRLAGQYVDYLMKRAEYDAARDVWLAQLGEGRGDYLVSDFLYNGGFEAEPSGCVFDWRISRAAGVEATFDERVAHSGRRSLQIYFRGEANPAYRGAAQEVVLEPGIYSLRAFVRTEGITTDQGVGLRIAGVRTEALTGSHDWMEIGAVVTVGGPVRVEIVRDKSDKFDNKIKGTVWIDDVTLKIINH